MRVLIRGAGDIATGVALRLYRSHMEVVMTDLPGVRPWIEATLPGAPVTWVTPPRMTDVDTPDVLDCPRFEHALADAVARSLAEPISSFDPSAVSWDACWARILEQLSNLKGGIDGRGHD